MAIRARFRRVSWSSRSSGWWTSGYNEVVLTGVDLTSWGATCRGRRGSVIWCGGFLKLVPGLPRLRLSSIDQVEADEALFAALAEEERLMPHLHLSLQAW